MDLGGGGYVGLKLAPKTLSGTSSTSSFCWSKINISRPHSYLFAKIKFICVKLCITPGYIVVKLSLEYPRIQENSGGKAPRSPNW